MTAEKFHAVELGVGVQREMIFVVRAWKAHAVAVMQTLFQILAELTHQRVSYFPGLYHVQPRPVLIFHLTSPPVFSADCECE